MLFLNYSVFQLKTSLPTGIEELPNNSSKKVVEHVFGRKIFSYLEFFHINFLNRITSSEAFSNKMP